ncbi:TPA: YHYH protein [Candidatus Poribacteria bacterium]|nr:YHYH protein [Candidatus Poribacteria bacterium]
MGQDNQPHQIKWFATEIDADPANVEFPAPEFTVDFSSDSIIVNSNGIPSFEFIAKTPNGLKVQAHNWEIPRNPVPAATFTQIPLLGTVAFTTTGLPIYGPNEAQHPDPYGDPYVNQILDFCHGHTGGQGDYHFHAAPECLIQHPDGSEEHYNIVGFALDGYPLIAHYKSVLDASGNPVLDADGETQFDWLETSGYEPNPAYKTQVLEGGEISTYAWDNYGYGAGRLDRTLDEGNGRILTDNTIKDGLSEREFFNFDYGYFITGEFPYFIAKYRGEVSQQNQQPGAGGPGGQRPGAGGPPQLSASQRMATQEILSEYDSENLSKSDIKSISDAFVAEGIRPSSDLKSEIEAAGFDPEVINYQPGAGGNTSAAPAESTVAEDVAVAEDGAAEVAVVEDGDKESTATLAVAGQVSNEADLPVTSGLMGTAKIGDVSVPVSFEADGTYSATFFSFTGSVASNGDIVELTFVNQDGDKFSRQVELTAKQVVNQFVSVSVVLRNYASFDLAIPRGTSLIHLPLVVTSVNDVATTVTTVGQLYDAIGADNVNFLITYDNQAKAFRSYLGDRSKGQTADREITADLGIIALMKKAATLKLKGDALGTDGKSQISLGVGLNLVGVPLKDSRISKVSDLLALEGLSALNAIVSDNGVFKVISQAGDDGDIDITGGQSFVMTSTAAATAKVSGEAWDNVSTATATATATAPAMAIVGIQDQDRTPVLEVHGSVTADVGARAEDFLVTVNNLTTGETLSTDTVDSGYTMTFVDVIGARAARIGDVLEITVSSTSSQVGVQVERHVVSIDDVGLSQIRVPDMLAYEVPTETALLPNYPNPFNPETWIPFRLAKDADVSLRIYNTAGSLVRTIELGHHHATVYETKGKAAYWDGRNNFGEQVASGVYFYRLQAGDYSQTRKMVILK